MKTMSLNVKDQPVERPLKKVVPLTHLVSLMQRAKREGRTVVQCHGVFDLLHLGHIRHLQAAKREGDILVVTVTPDRFVRKGPGRPVFPEHLRLESLAALEVVDYVALMDVPDASQVIRVLRPHVYVKGNEYERSENDVTGNIEAEEQAVKEIGGRIHFTHEITFSSSSILNTHFDTLTPDVRSYLSEFRKRYSAEDIITRLRALQSMRVVVVGDAIVDEYHFCDLLGMASKSTCLNARFLSTERYAGGALAVANHLVGFCSDVHLVTCLGGQGPGEDVVRTYLDPRISPHVLLRPDGPTTVKRRFLERYHYQKLFEVTSIEDRPLPEEVVGRFQEQCASLLPSCDLAVVADFGHGLLDQRMVVPLSQEARYIALNVQLNSTNRGFNVVTKYPRADYLCLDEQELRLSFQDRFGDLAALMGRACDTLSSRAVMVTQGKDGTLTSSSHHPPYQSPVFSTEVVDTIGAGDALFAITAPCAAAGFEPELLGFIGNAVGALKIRILGNQESIESVTLYKYITTLLK